MRLPLTVIGSTIVLLILIPRASLGQQVKPPETPEYKLPVSMLATDEFAFLSAVSAVESPTKRARIRLELLGASLAKHRTSTNSRKAAGRQ